MPVTGTIGGGGSRDVGGSGSQALAVLAAEDGRGLLAQLYEDCISVLESVGSDCLPTQERRVTAGALTDNLREIRDAMSPSAATADVATHAYLPGVQTREKQAQWGSSTLAGRELASEAARKDRQFAQVAWEDAESEYRSIRQEHAKEVRKLAQAIGPIETENGKLAHSANIAWELVLRHSDRAGQEALAESAAAEAMRAESEDLEQLSSNLAALQAELEDPSLANKFSAALIARETPGAHLAHT